MKSKGKKGLYLLLTIVIFFLLSGSIIVKAEFSDAKAYAPENDLIAYYPFDGDLKNQVTGREAEYVGKTSNPGSLKPIEGPGRNYFTDKGRLGGGYSFGGGATSGAALKLDTTISKSDATVSFWIKVNKKTAFSSILFWPHGGVNDDYSNLMVSSRWIDGVSPIWASGDITGSNPLQNYTREEALEEGIWKHMTYVIEDSQLTCYMDSKNMVLSGSKGKVHKNYLINKEIILGGNFWDEMLNGVIDELYIYDRALSEEEVSAVYEASGGEDGTQVTFSPNQYNLVINPEIHETDTITLYANAARNGNLTEVDYRVVEGEELIDYVINEKNSGGRSSITITPKRDGVAIIEAFAQTEDGIVWDRCTLNISTKLESLTMSSSSLEVNIEQYSGTYIPEQVKLDVVCSPANAVNKRIRWSSSDTEVAQVNQSGLVTLKKKGSSVITAESVSNPNMKAECLIRVTETVYTNTLVLNKTKATIYTKGSKTVALTQKKLVGKDKNLVWKSDRPHIAAVSDQGVVTAKKAGTAKITATANGVSQTVTITVKKPSISVKNGSKAIKRNQTVTLKKGKKLTLKTKVEPSGKVTYVSKNKKVASVSKGGVVKAKKAGTTSITVKSSKLGTSLTFKVKVK